ncbi:hypothetical protein [Alkalimonas sp.]|uniref:hypothetical protein n=1 Tax=Alkalimonas sp. TaxID=1872453 RepID=UPI00263B6657|nr:hypothetical protein [Alkalimonas sp.]MCC5826634.1 hypothetical protein [Alkalimonas sp.]
MRNNWIPCFPTRWLNRSLFLIGTAGIALQWLAVGYAWWQGFSVSFHWWFHWLAPLLCVLWGTIPRLQLQPEPKP